MRDNAVAIMEAGLADEWFTRADESVVRRDWPAARKQIRLAIRHGIIAMNHANAALCRSLIVEQNHMLMCADFITQEAGKA